jgi:pyridoxine 5'-phosphate synthase PdxJ
LIPLQQTGSSDIVTSSGKIMPSLVTFLPEIRQQLPPNGSYDVGIRRDTPIEIVRQIQAAFLAAVNSDVFRVVAEQQKLLIDVKVGEEADRRAAELEASTATLFQELGIPGARSADELGLPEAGEFNQWWPPEDYQPLSL